ncbi:MAG: serine/threonine-protein kinase [Minicystis sp.]
MKVCPVCHREYGSGVATCTDDGVPLVAMSTDVNLRPEELVGRIVEGRYKIERIIGKGGMGTVYACRHVVVGKLAAMKVLRTGVERGDGVLQRFVREAQTANLLRSRHIVEASDFGQLPNGSFFVVMELLEGHDLAHAMRQGLNRAQLVHVFTQVAETLQLAHDKGVVHRDLKPDNVFLVNEAGDPLFVKLLDFGIAKILHGESNGGLTETGVILGTPYYMSPEQARAETIDHRTDIYSLGVMMYRAFTGRLPFIADSTMGVLTRHITEAPEPPSKLVKMDQATERLILRCMAKNRDQRFQSMREVVEGLRTVPTGAVPSIAEHTTVYDGPIAGAAAASASYAAATGATSAPSSSAATGAYARPQATGQHPAAYAGQTSGTYAQPSGAYAQTSGAYAQPSGAYAQPSGAYAQPSGSYPMAAPQTQPSGPHVTSQGAPPAGLPQASLPAIQTPAAAALATASGKFPNDPATTSGTYGAANAGNGFDPRASAAPGGGLAAAPGSGETTRGLAATGAIVVPPPRAGTSTATLVFGAIAMLSLGALGALLLYQARPPAPNPAASAPPATPPSATAAAGASATAAPAPAPPTASASATADAAASASAAARPKVGGPIPKAAPTATATAGTKRTPRDIRSPFD